MHELGFEVLSASKGACYDGHERDDDDVAQYLGVSKYEGMLRPKSKGSGIMVSILIDERIRFLALTDEEHEEANKHDITITQRARETLEYGESREGYWNSNKFMMQMNNAVKIAEIKYPPADKWKIIWIFDHSSCHMAMQIMH